MKASIIGGGLVGSLWSIYLSKIGYNVKVFEKRADLRSNKNSSGRSINLALSYRGIQSLKRAGIYDYIENITIPMYGRLMHNKIGGTAYQKYGTHNEAIYSVPRKELNMILINLAEDNGVDFSFNHNCQGVDFKKNILTFNNNQYQSDIIFGADGANSFIRSKIQEELKDFSIEDGRTNTSYKEIYLPAYKNGTCRLNNKALHIWPRGHFMLIALPNLDASFTCTLFMPTSGLEQSFEDLNSKSKISIFFKETFPDFYDLYPEFINNWDDYPISNLSFVKCYPWSINNTLIIGDAAHAVVPFYGQGMNSGFEDCEILYDLALQYNNDWKNIMDSFQKSRKIDADAIVNLSLGNYHVMRDYVSNEKFLLQKKIENQFSIKHPDKWTPLYSMVTFSKTPYNKAFLLGKKQDAIMKKVMKIDKIKDIWETEYVEQFILKMLKD